MAFNELQQIKQLLTEKKHLLVIFRKNGTGDSVAASLALTLFLEKLGKHVDIVSDGFVLPRSLKFLKKSAEIKSSFNFLQKFILTVDVKRSGLQELSYDIKDEKLRIFVTPKNGFITRDDIHTAQSEFKYEVIFVVDTPDLESLGPSYDNNTEFFYKKPIVNFDHNLSNEHYGQTNFIDSTATSTSEVIYNFVNELGQEFLDEDIATAILTGIIANTRSFKTTDIKPQTLNIASKLISLGANRDNIVQNLYRTKSISTLKLWGQALSHLQHDGATGLVWTSLTREDFVRCGAEENELKDIIDEIISNSPEAKMILILHESIEPGVRDIMGSLTCEKHCDPQVLLKPFNPSGSRRRVSFKIENHTLKEAEETVLTHIRKTLTQQQ